MDSEYEEKVKLLSLLYLTFASIDRDDDRLWSLDPKGCFSVQSCYSALIGVNLHEKGWKHNWNTLVPPKILGFCWIAKLHKILTVDKLRIRGHVLVSGCLLCLKIKETANHLLIHCRFAARVWAIILNRLGNCWVMPSFVLDLFKQWRITCVSPDHKKFWNLSIFVVV